MIDRTRKRFLVELVGVLGIVVGCSKGSSDSSAGSAGGPAPRPPGDPAAGAFVLRDTVAQRLHGGGDEVVVQLVSLPGACNLYKTGAPAPSRDYDIITIELHDFTGPITPGVKTIVAKGAFTPTQGHALYVGNRGCNTRYGGPANGTLEITALDDAHIAGSYDLTFVSGWPYADKKLTGTFDASFCNLEPNQLASITCK